MRISFDGSRFFTEQQFAAMLNGRMHGRAWQRVRAAAFTLERNVKLRMPVDTGRARASWGHGSPPALPEDSIWQENERDLTVIEGSNVEYIPSLNEGSSTQAPAGFIDAEVAKALESLANGLAQDIANGWAEP